jgi:UDP-2-acetamido-2-deoxy-ribo-hexuluronate aminotransferase
MTVLENEIEARSRIAQRYNDLLKGWVQLPKLMPHNTHVYAQYTVEVDNREKIRELLADMGVPTAVHYPLGIHMQKVMQDYGFLEGQFPYTESAAKRVLSLPMHPYLEESVQDEIVKKLKSVL